MAPDTPFVIPESELGGTEVLGPQAPGPVAAPGTLVPMPRVGYLVELTAPARPRNWRPASTIFADATTVFADDLVIGAGSSTGTYAAELGADVIVVDRVTENGVALTRVATPDLVGGLLGSWCFDMATHTLWVRTTDDLSASTKRIRADVVDCGSLGELLGPVLRNGMPVVYEGRVRTLPTVSLRIGGSDVAAGAMATVGELVYHNEDGYIDRVLAERLALGGRVDIWYGDLTPLNRELLTHWLRAEVGGPQTSLTDGILPLQGRTLDQPVCRETFTVATHPDMDPALEGVAIPRVWGPVPRAECFRIGSGRWRCSAGAVDAVLRCWTAADVAVALLTVTPALGEFTVAPAFDTEERLFVEVEGLRPWGPGTILQRILLDATDLGAAEDLDGPAFAQADTDRPVNIGLQVTQGSVREALDTVAKAAFVDWFVTRTGRVSVLPRALQQGNLVRNPRFEDNAKGWWTAATGDVRRTTAFVMFKGTGCGWVRGAWEELSTWVPFMRPGGRYTIAPLLAELSVNHLGVPAGSPIEQYQVVVRRHPSDSLAQAVAVGDPIPLPRDVWARARWRVAIPSTFTLPSAASEDYFADDTLATADAAGLVVTIAVLTSHAEYPNLLIDEFEAAEALVLDDRNAEVVGTDVHRLVLSRVTCPYGRDAQGAGGGVVTRTDAAVDELYPTVTERRQLEGSVADEASAGTVADATLEYYRRPRATVKARVFDWSTPLVPGRVVDVADLSRVWPLPLASQLYRITGVQEAPPSEGDSAPVMLLEAEVQSDPMTPAVAVA